MQPNELMMHMGSSCTEIEVQDEHDVLVSSMLLQKAAELNSTNFPLEGFHSKRVMPPQAQHSNSA